MNFILMCLFVAAASAATIDSAENKQYKRAVYGVGFGPGYGIPHAPIIATHAPLISHAAPLTHPISYARGYGPFGLGPFRSGLGYPYGGVGYPYGGLGNVAPVAPVPAVSPYYFGSPSIF